MSLAGILILLLSIKPVKEFAVEYLDFLETMNNWYIIIAGAVVLIVGILLLRGNSEKGHKRGEVPIYEKGRVVGYRRR